MPSLRIAAQLEVAGRRAANGHQPERHRRIGEIGADLVVGPRQPIDPVIRAGRPRRRETARTTAGSRATRSMRTAGSVAVARMQRVAVAHLEVRADGSDAPSAVLEHALPARGRREDLLEAPRRPASVDALQRAAAPRSARRAPAAMLSALVAAMSRQMSAGLDASRVVSRRPRPASASPSAPACSPTTCISALTVELRQMAEVGEEPIVHLRRHDAAPRAAPRRTASASSQRRLRRLGAPASGSTDGRRTDPRARPRRRPTAAPASGWPPMNSQMRPAAPRRPDDRTLGAADVGDERAAGRCAGSSRERRDVRSTGAASTTRSASRPTTRRSSPPSSTIRISQRRAR